MAQNMVVLKSTQANAQNTEVLREVWETINPGSCPHHYNFHMHTVYSDGKLTPNALIEQAVAIGLKGMAITDHHSVRGYYIAQDWLEKARRHQPEKSLPHLWTGIEITSNLFGTEVHILGYGFDPEHPEMKPYLGGNSPQGIDELAMAVIDALHQAGGLVILAHPARYRSPASRLIPIAADLGIDGVEAYYAYSNPKPWSPSPKETEEVTQLSQVYRLLKTCGTDTHGMNLLQRL